MIFGAFWIPPLLQNTTMPFGVPNRGKNIIELYALQLQSAEAAFRHTTMSFGSPNRGKNIIELYGMQLQSAEAALRQPPCLCECRMGALSRI